MSVEWEYEVVVDGDRITGKAVRLSPHEVFQEYSERIDDDDVSRLRRDTIEVLRSWLNRWTALTRMNLEHLAVSDTFAVLGRHLYALVFPATVGQGLVIARRDAREDKTTLRLLLTFKPKAENLAQLPWELLHDDGNFLLASGLRLVLSRRLGLSRLSLLIPEPPLVVKFLVTVPDSAEYREQRKELLESVSNVAESPEYLDYSSRITSKVLDHWDREEASSWLATEPYPQVVHVIGVCRRSWELGQEVMEIYLDDGGGQPRWRNAEVLVALFNDNKYLPAENRIRLVVLHLCEPSPLDFEVTFERLAPQLIRQDIPAVLAMQYPLSGQAAKRFTQRLYKSLAEEDSIEEAVQRVRKDLYYWFDKDRLFGSPVLYMQTVDSLLLKQPTGSLAGADAGPSSGPAAKPPPRSTLDVLLQRLASLDEPAEYRDEAERVMRAAGNWPPQVSEVERRLTALVREHAHDTDLARVFSMLVKVIKQEDGWR